jgi:hypothetical protein
MKFSDSHIRPRKVISTRKVYADRPPLPQCCCIQGAVQRHFLVRFLRDFEMASALS